MNIIHESSFLILLYTIAIRLNCMCNYGCCTIHLCLRMNENMEFPNMSGEDIEWLQDSFVKVIFGRIEESLANRRMKKEDAGKVGELNQLLFLSKT